VPLILDLMEGLYLAETDIIEIYEKPDETKVNLKKLRQKAKQLYDEFEDKYAVYRDFREKGLIVTPGIKFGCDFAVYKYGPGIEHAPYMVVSNIVRYRWGLLNLHPQSGQTALRFSNSIFISSKLIFSASAEPTPLSSSKWSALKRV